MKAVSQGFKDAIKEYGRELDSIITYELDGNTITLGMTDINSVSQHYEGDILKSVMKQLDIDSNINIPLGTEINYQFGVKVSGTYEYIDFGNFIVFSSEKLEDSNSYKLVCYDKMLYSMKNYQTPTINDVAITYPISVKDYLSALCTNLGLTFANENDTFPNSGELIMQEPYLDKNGKSLNYTYRDALDDLAVITASTIVVDNDTLKLKYVDGDTTPFYKYKRIGEITGTSNIRFNGETIRTIRAYEFSIRFKINSSISNNTNIIISNEHRIYITPTRLYFDNSYFNYSFASDTTYTIRISNNVIFINNSEVGTISTTTLTNPYIFGNSNVTIYNVTIGSIYDLYYDNEKLIPVLIRTDSQGTKIIETDYSGNIPTPTENETIDEAYLKDINITMGKSFGPINTLSYTKETLDSNNSYKSYASIPETLSSDLRKEVALSKNEILENMLSYWGVLYNILNKIYGITYYVNDFSSFGITWLEICDRYNIQITTDGITNTYPCIMFNDDILITQGLEENISTNKQEQRDSEYNTLSKDERIQNRQDTINSNQQELIEKQKTLTLNNEWIMGYKASGDNLSVILPFNNPDKENVSVNITSAEVYSSGWQTITYGGITTLQTFVKLGFSTEASLTNGDVYLVRIVGEISID